MFEDSTFESTGRIHTSSRSWMVATFTFNTAILLTMILIPILFPQALPRLTTILLMDAPSQPAPEPKPMPQAEHAAVGQTQMQGNVILLPTRIPTRILIVKDPEPQVSHNVSELGDAMGNANTNIFTNTPKVTVAEQKPAHISSGVMEGLLIQKTIPLYPPIARAAHVQGTVVLQATISRVGSIENLRVSAGPQMLQQAAMDAVRNWRYRPYLLDSAPVEVETTVNVVFSLQ